MRDVPRPTAWSDNQLVTLIGVHLRVAFFQLMEFFRIVFRYYRFRRFCIADLLLGCHYVVKSPFRISKQHSQRNGKKDLYTYGETPLTTLDHIARECRILSTDVVYELGCGTGRTVLWLASVVDCETHGIDNLPTFIRKAERVKYLTGMKKAFFEECDFLTVSFQRATVLYLYGTLLEQETILQLMSCFATLKSGTKIISVSYALTDYCTFFRVEKSFEAIFPWGKTEVYLNIRK